ncbi:2-hydroxyacyl-CoA dehydratase family protein [Natroniella acetigena]|uniref:double-cubane-cluster-containing anaerobic reductase n=1 Tax=Natroniella acetigena TaxID=52004 RepID=UPI00200AA1DC|nr:double-cubane-cluster-containing anaerobic reductase [Natroniella acetigena]MCK8827407.1 2-hydroxyacyl-CoA dehydratase family protein [Natroniella acetigena]
MTKLPKSFDEFSNAKREGFLKVKELKEQGKDIIGTYCTYTPKELIMAAGAIPIGLCGTSEEPIQEAEKDLPRNLCPLIKSSYGFGVTDTCPYFYFSDLIVGETTCDGKKKMYELLKEKKAMHVMQLPQNNEDKESFNLWKKEMKKLKEKLEKQFDVEITDEKLKEAINLRNREREIMKQFYELGTLCPPPIEGSEILEVLYGAEFKFNKEEHIKEMGSLLEDIKEDYQQGERKIAEDKPRILITGCPIAGDSEKVVKAIENSGGVVVCFENCFGVKANEELVAENINPIDALTKKYLNIPCSVMSPNDGRLDLLSELIDRYQVDGVVDIALQGCHTYNIETATIKEFVNNEKNISYTNIETDYSQTDTGQLATRLGAFIEML